MRSKIVVFWIAEVRGIVVSLLSLKTGNKKREEEREKK